MTDRMTLKSAVDAANKLHTITQLQAALGMDDAQVARRIDLAELAYKAHREALRTDKGTQRAMRWLLVEKWLDEEETRLNDDTRAATENDLMVFSEDTPQGGKIVLNYYPEGYALRYHGEIVWRSYPFSAVKMAEPLSTKMTPAAAAFKAANESSPVVEGRANPQGGGVYMLDDGTTWQLTLEDARSLPDYWMPTWKHDIKLPKHWEAISKPEPTPNRDPVQTVVDDYDNLLGGLRSLGELLRRDGVSIKLRIEHENETGRNPHVQASYVRHYKPKPRENRLAYDPDELI